MKKRALQFAIGLLVISNGAFAQWTGGDINVTTSRIGNVGIGTSNAPVKLSLAVTQLNDGIYLSGNNTNIGLLTNTTGGAWNQLTQTGDHLLFWRAVNPDDVNAGGLVIGPWSNSAKGLKITSAGNVGIGTVETGSYKLNVAGRMGTQEIWVSGNGVQNVALINNLTPGAWNPLTQPGDNMLLWKGSNADQADAGGLVIAPWSNSNNGIRISSQGNVSIGTSTSNTYKLAVEGKIAARGVKVTLAGFADYVFDSTYQLRPLASLQQYINQNKHLPGIPSAEEVKKDGGVELGEMNVKLLEKIEELTLYVIELKKENEQMQKDIKGLKEKK